MKVNIKLLATGEEHQLINLSKNKEASDVFAISNIIEDRFQQIRSVTFHIEDASFVYAEMVPEYDMKFETTVEGEMICQYFVLEGSYSGETLDGKTLYERRTGMQNIVYWKEWSGITIYKKNVPLRVVSVYLKKSFFLKFLGKQNNLLNNGFSKLKEGETWSFGKLWSSMMTNEMKALLHEIINTKREEIYLKLFLEARLKELLLLQIESLSDVEQMNTEKPSSSQKLTESIHKIIKENTFGEFSLKEIVQKLGSIISTVSNSFKEHYNIAIFQYWNSLRFNEAK